MPDMHICREVQKKGFTVVELLLAIGIIAILVMVTSVGLSSLTERAKGVQCLANLKTLAGGFQRYVFDHQGQLPIRTRPVNSSTQQQWHREMWPSLRAVNELRDWGQARTDMQGGAYKRWPFHCPNDLDPTSTTPGLSYAANTRLTDARIAHVTAKHVLLLEVKNSYMVSGSQAERPNYLGRHSGRMHVLFGDYRVEAIPPREIPSFSNYPEAWQPAQ